MGVNGEALQLHSVYKKPYFLLQVTRQSVSVLQVTWKSVLRTSLHFVAMDIHGDEVHVTKKGLKPDSFSSHLRVWEQG